MYGQTRILFAMGRDGMIPSLFNRLNPRTLTPVPATIIVAVVISILAGPAPDQLPGRDDEHRHAGGVHDRLDRRDHPAPHGARPAPRLQGARLYPVTPILSIIGCLWIISDLRVVTLYVFVGWAAVALTWYFFYGRSHAVLGREEAS